MEKVLTVSRLSMVVKADTCLHSMPLCWLDQTVVVLDADTGNMISDTLVIQP